MAQLKQYLKVLHSFTFMKLGLVKLSDEKGMVLIVGILLIVVLSLIGTTAVITSTTDMKISANYKVGTQAFFAAEAGVEEARARMKLGAANPINDNHPTNTGWAVYIGTDTKAQGKGYNSGNTLHTRVASLQSTLDYTVKIIHQTDSSGNILYWGDSNGDGINEKNTTTGKNIYLVTSYGTASGANRVIEAEITKVPPISVKAALYVEAATTIQGTSTNVIGVDQCGGSSLPGVATTLLASTVSPNGNPTVCGANYTDCATAGTWDVVGSATNMDVQAMIDGWKHSATTSYEYTANQTDSGMAWGEPTMGANLQSPSSCSEQNIVYYNMNGYSIRLSGGTTGCGVLIIDGDIEISGGFSWYGIVIASGSITYTGGGDKNVTGAVISGGSVDADLVGGNANIVYCSSATTNQTEYQPLRRLSWKDKNI